MSPILEAGAPGTWSVIGARSVHDEQNHQGCKGLGKDHFAPVTEDHAKQEKWKKAIRHIETLLEQIRQLQDEIENTLQTEVSLEREIVNLVAADEQSSHKIPKRKQVKEYPKQQADALPAPNKPARKSKERLQKKTKYDDNHHVNHRNVRKKLCLKCKKQKARSDFHKDRSCKEGLARWCKACKAKAGKKYRKKQAAMKN